MLSTLPLCGGLIGREVSLLDLAGTTSAGGCAELVSVGILLAREVNALPVYGLVGLLQDLEEMEVVDALQYVYRLIDVATIVVVGKLLNTADDVALGGKVLDLILQTSREDATYVLAVEGRCFPFDAVTLDVVIDGVVGDEELFATTLS